MLTLFEDESTKISSIENPRSDHITLCFTGIGHALGGIDVQREEFLKASSGSTTIFVVDKFRSWGNNLDFSMLASMIDSYGSTKKVNAVGNSMGGFLAIVASKYIRMHNVVAFVPQYSVNKSIIPTENRWDVYVDAIREWFHLSLGGYFIDHTNYYIIAGYGGDDEKHLNLMPNKGNINKIYFRNNRFIHNVAATLKEDGILYDVIHDCFRGIDGADIIRERLTRQGYEAFAPTDWPHN